MSNDSEFFVRYDIFFAYVLLFINLNTQHGLYGYKYIKTIKQTQQNQRLQEWVCLCIPQTVLWYLCM